MQRILVSGTRHTSRLVRVVFTAGVSLSLIGPAMAQPAGGQRKGPPPEAIAACESRANDEACEFVGRRGKVSGTCVTPRPDRPLACRPVRDSR